MKRLKLRSRIVEKFGTIGNFCSYIGISAQTACSVLAGSSTPRAKNIVRWCDALGIDPEDCGEFFYAETLEINS